MRAFAFLSLLSVALAATKCDAKRSSSSDRSPSRGTGKGPRVAKSRGSSSLRDRTLLPELVQTASQRDGLNVSAVGQVRSLTDRANFVNFCKGKKLTNGLQVKEGSCNGVVMGDIPSVSNMVGAKFQFPKNFQQGLKAFTDFTVQLRIQGIETGSFTNPNEAYYSAPQHLNKQGVIIGHTHIVINQIKSFDDTEVADPIKFAFFKGIDPKAVNGISSVVVSKGLPAGTFRMCSINTAANHQPVLMPVAQHNSNDDCIYFSTTFQGKTNRRRAQAAHRLAAQSADLD